LIFSSKAALCGLFNLKKTVGDDKVMQDSELEALLMEANIP
jgi:hypothetical protein